MNPHARTPILLALLALALACLAPAAAVAQERTVSATGEATLKVANDSAGLGFSVSLERRTRGAALRAVSAGLRRVIAAAKGTAGVGAGDVITGRVSVRRTHRGKRVAYRAGEGVSVVTHQPEKAGDLIEAAIGAGATGVSGPNFFVGDSEQAFGKALAAAFDKAKGQATILAAQAGATLGAAIAIDEGEGAEFLPEASPELPYGSGAGCATDARNGPAGPTSCNAAPPPTKPGTSTVTATVHVVFALQ
jgi:uncharacterized protein YggE